MSHVTDRFGAAIRTLVGDGPLKQRLIRAVAEHLGDLDNADLPIAARREFMDLKEALQRRNPVGRESRVQATVQKMSPAEAGGHAGTIVQLYIAVLGLAERAEPLKVVNSPKKAPRYLTNRP